MKKFFLTSFSLALLALIFLVIFLSTKGYETDRFNSLISNKLKDSGENLEVDLEKIKVKLDLKKFNIFLNTNNPKIKYYDIDLPINKIDVYFDFFSIFKREIQVNRANVSFNDLDISNVKKLILRTKPSNFKSFISNNISKGIIKGSIDLNFLENLELSNYKLNGNLREMNINYFDKIEVNNTSFNFIADSNLILINEISFNFMNVPVTNGSIRVDKKDIFLVEGSLSTNLNSDTEKLSELIKLFPNLNFTNKKIAINGNFLNKFKFKLDKTLKVQDYSYNLKGSLREAKVYFDKGFKSFFFKNEVKEIFLDKSSLIFDLSKKKESKISIEGLYKLSENRKYKKYKFDNSFNKLKSRLNISLEFDEFIFVELLNYEKKEDKVANLNVAFNLENDEIKIESANYSEGKSLISLNKFEINKKNQIKRFKNIKVKTFKDGKENNNFEVLFGKKIIIKGKSYDSSNLIKNINNKDNVNLFRGINKEVRISFDNIFTKFAESLNNFNLIGKIEKGKFVKISSKSEFSEDRYLDISLKRDLNSGKKILEIYSGFAKPLLADFNFFKGIEDGQLLFTSVFDDKTSSSNLQVKNFKVLNAPAFAKLLALADLTGPAVLLSGEGLGFDSLEIKFIDDDKIRTIKEIYAVGPSITILMEGYVENKSGLTSLRGTMVPAKEINKLISKIPVIGDILIGKEVGEGVFGVSFKMKGPPGKIKTTVNPIKTLTPRFITRALEKRKKKK